MSAAAQTTWVRQIADALARSGVETVAISPGSRSAPLALALTEHPRLRTEVIVDERVAAFFALGVARTTGKPAAALCTSGSAGAHYHPAVVEAGRAGLPLLLLTADRPPERHHRLAPQTIEQVAFYGAHCRGCFDLGPAEAAPALLGATARTVAQAVARARGAAGAPAGPVQLNLRLRKPLEPAPDAPPIVDVSLPRVHPPQPAPSATSLDTLAELCRVKRRGLDRRRAGPPWSAPDHALFTQFSRPRHAPGGRGGQPAAMGPFFRAPSCASWEWLLRCGCLADQGPRTC
ncbi:MAG: thiamine pyrophosphate-binding protein [Acidobacteriota bacterium]|nr:thiamine pyrophosphate-binding protein [Acidobacteriota bacterium]